MLSLLEDYPDLFKALLTETMSMSNDSIKQSSQFKAFYSQICQYNNTFTFTSLGIKFNEKLLWTTQGIYSFHIHRVLYHQMNSLKPAPGDKSGWA